MKIKELQEAIKDLNPEGEVTIHDSERGGHPVIKIGKSYAMGTDDKPGYENKDELCLFISFNEWDIYYEEHPDERPSASVHLGKILWRAEDES